MAIRMMVSKEVFEGREASGRKVVKVSDYPGHVEGSISHAECCPHFARLGGRSGFSCEEMRPEGLFDDCIKDYKDPRATHGGSCSGPRDALYLETTYKGLVLELREYNGRDDSDFYAVVWDPENGTTDRVDYATTRGWTYPNSASVDATPEVLEAYAAFRKAADERRRAEHEASRKAELKAAIEREAKEPRKGGRAKVVKGRKVPKGTEGVVIWVGGGDWGPRVGIKDDAGTVHWTALGNVVSLGWEKEVDARLRKAGIE
jgi:hypothetical protein